MATVNLFMFLIFSSIDKVYTANTHAALEMFSAGSEVRGQA